MRKITLLFTLVLLSFGAAWAQDYVTDPAQLQASTAASPVYYKISSKRAPNDYLSIVNGALTHSSLRASSFWYLVQSGTGYEFHNCLGQVIAGINPCSVGTTPATLYVGCEAAQQGEGLYISKTAAATGTNCLDVSNAGSGFSAGWHPASGDIDGTSFRFFQAEMSEIEPFIAPELQTLKEQAEAIADKGDKVGQYSQEKLDAIVALCGQSATPAVLGQAQQLWAEAWNRPDPSKYYNIVSAFAGYQEKQNVRKAIFPQGGFLQWKNFDQGDLAQMWQFTPSGDGFIMTNTGNGRVVGAYQNDRFQMVDAGSGSPVKIALRSDHRLNLAVGSSPCMHTGGHNNGAGVSGNVVGWIAFGQGDGASSWYIEEAPDPVEAARSGLTQALEAAEQAKEAMGQLPVGTALGQYPQEAIDEQVAAIAAAIAPAEQEAANSAASINDLTQAKTTLTDAVSAAQAAVNAAVALPKAGGYYRFHNTLRPNNLYMSISEDYSNMKATVGDDTDPRQVWQLVEGTADDQGNPRLYLKNVFSAKYPQYVQGGSASTTAMGPQNDAYNCTIALHQAATQTTEAVWNVSVGGRQINCEENGNLNYWFADAAHFNVYEVAENDVEAMLEGAKSLVVDALERDIEQASAVVGNLLGQYPQEAIDQARTTLEDPSATVADLTAAKDALEAAKIKPQAGKYYRLTNTLRTLAIGLNAAQNKLQGVTPQRDAESDLCQVWKAVEQGGQLYLQNLYSEQYPQDVPGGADATTGMGGFNAQLAFTCEEYQSATASSAAVWNIKINGRQINCEENGNMNYWYEAAAHFTIAEVKETEAELMAAVAKRDKQPLMQAMEAGEAGQELGQYPQSAFDAAQAVIDNEQATRAEVRQATADFAAAVVKPQAGQYYRIICTDNEKVLSIDNQAQNLLMSRADQTDPRQTWLFQADGGQLYLKNTYEPNAQALYPQAVSQEQGGQTAVGAKGEALQAVLHKPAKNGEPAQWCIMIGQAQLAASYLDNVWNWSGEGSHFRMEPATDAQQLLAGFDDSPVALAQRLLTQEIEEANGGFGFEVEKGIASVWPVEYTFHPESLFADAKQVNAQGGAAELDKVNAYVNALKNYLSCCRKYGMPASVVYEQTAAYGLITLPANAAQPEGFSFYALNKVDKQGVVQLAVVRGELQAGLPYVVKAPVGARCQIVGYDKQAEAQTKGLLHGVLAPQAAPAGSYVLDLSGEAPVFRPASEDETEPSMVEANTSYLVLPEGAEAFPALYFDAATATAVGSATLAQPTDAIYDLSGRRVSQTGHGLYIVAGKKVIR